MVQSPIQGWIHTAAFMNLRRTVRRGYAVCDSGGLPVCIRYSRAPYPGYLRPELPLAYDAAGGRWRNLRTEQRNGAGREPAAAADSPAICKTGKILMAE